MLKRTGFKQKTFLTLPPGVFTTFAQKIFKKDILKKGIIAPEMEVVFYNSKKKTGFQFKRSPLAKKGKSATALIKDDIQALLRKIVIKRDGGCVLRNRKDCGNCGWNDKHENLILQAEHLVTRGASNYFGDLRNIVCLCVYHHTMFKPQFSFRYWNAIEQVIGKERWDWFKRAEADNRPYKVDMKLVKLDLESKLKKI